jgi:hypothetical protein
VHHIITGNSKELQNEVIATGMPNKQYQGEVPTFLQARMKQLGSNKMEMDSSPAKLDVWPLQLDCCQSISIQ